MIGRHQKPCQMNIIKRITRNWIKTMKNTYGCSAIPLYVVNGPVTLLRDEFWHHVASAWVGAGQLTR